MQLEYTSFVAACLDRQSYLEQVTPIQAYILGHERLIDHQTSDSLHTCGKKSVISVVSFVSPSRFGPSKKYVAFRTDELARSLSPFPR
jgi:hypothetical protein